MDDEQIKADAVDMPKDQSEFDALVPSLKEWDVIFGHETESDTLVIFYGKKMMEGIVKHNESVPLEIGAVRYRSSTGELEALCAMVQVVKGSHCYGE